MMISARNQIPGKVSDVRPGSVMAEVHVDIGGGKTIVSVITKDSAERLGLKKGDQVTAIIKSTEVLIAK
ncbi:MAG TPA: TOBE domain-containing protein [Gemmatimonadaceae bacterium]|nr:TOBE domain-containing protein [Gemmatimonadaceae bacterium]